VPRESSNLDPGNHLEVVRSSVRRFFQRADPEFKGVVSEERFRAFLRRSGLQDSLTASELRRLTDKLKQRGSGKDRHETVIDYEKYVHFLSNCYYFGFINSFKI
jgi:Ca2+-binding EF-hand superfamily protein